MFLHISTTTITITIKLPTEIICVRAVFPCGNVLSVVLVEDVVAIEVVSVVVLVVVVDVEVGS